MTSGRRTEWTLALPLALFFLAFFAGPLAVLVVESFAGGAGGPTLAHYARFLGDGFYLSILWSTLWLGVKATILCLVLAYPLAWLMVHASARTRAILSFIVVLPILTSVVVRTFAWIVILGGQGILNKALLAAGAIDRPLKLLFTETGVVIVLAQVMMPLMVLPILATMSKIDPNLRDASATLGAGEWRTFWKITLPLSAPGVIAGCILVYAGAITAFVTQTLIGSAQLLYMPLAIYQQAIGANNWAFASAMSVIFMAAVLIVVYFLNLAGRVSRGNIYAG
jgi:putative spermidine/putrescine transport system permease protein